MGSIIQTPQQTKIANANFDRRLAQLILISTAEGANAGSMAVEMYSIVIEALSRQADDKDFIEETIEAFSSILREAVQLQKELSDEKTINETKNSKHPSN